MRTGSKAKLAVFVAVIAARTIHEASAQNLNPFDKDSDVRKVAREIDKARLRDLPDFDNRTTFRGFGEVVKGWTTLQNLGKSEYYGRYLDIDGGKGNVILEKATGTGVYWKVAKDDRDFNGFASYTITNLGKSDYYGHYLDITQEGRVILEKDRGSGTHWFVRQMDDREGVPAYVIQNLGRSPYFGWFLDISGSHGTIALAREPGSGCFWYLVNKPLGD